MNFNSKSFDNTLGKFTVKQAEGINPNFFDFQIKFNAVNNKKAQSILHFLENKNGFSTFQVDMFAPYTGTRYFFCPEWGHTYNFKDNNDISARLIEYKLNLTNNTYVSKIEISTPNPPSTTEFIPVRFGAPKVIITFNPGPNPTEGETETIEQPKNPGVFNEPKIPQRPDKNKPDPGAIPHRTRVTDYITPEWFQIEKFLPGEIRH